MKPRAFRASVRTALVVLTPFALISSLLLSADAAEFDCGPGGKPKREDGDVRLPVRQGASHGGRRSRAARRQS